MPGRLDQQPAGMAVAGLGDRALATSPATGLLTGHQAEPGPDRGAGEAMPVGDLHGQPNPGQHPDPAQTAQPTDQRRPGRGGGRLGDGASRRSRRAWTARTAPWASSKATRRPGWTSSTPTLASQRACAWVQAAPAKTSPWRSRSFDSRWRARIRSARASSRARTRSRAASSAWVGTRTPGSSPMCSNRASRSASRRSVLTRSPGGRSSLDDATTTQPPRPPGAPGPARTRSGQPHRRPDRAGQRPHPAQDRLGGRREPQRPHLPSGAVQHSGHDRPGMHVQADRRTLQHHPAPPVLAALPPQRRQPAPTYERGAGLHTV
jgi:hypothetical protein